MMANIIHKVKSDETLKSISRKYRVPSYLILLENKVKEIYIGMRLIIPSPDGIEYVVKPFESLDIIAEKFNIKVSELIEFNKGIQNVFLGQTIYIPR